MKSFKSFLKEDGLSAMPVGVTKNNVDLFTKETVDEINRNLNLVTQKHVATPYEAWIRVRKVMDNYNIALPRVILDGMHGEQIVPISQFSATFSTTYKGEFKSNVEPIATHYLHFTYSVDDTHLYRASAVVKSEDELSESANVRTDEYVHNNGERAYIRHIDSRYGTTSTTHKEDYVTGEHIPVAQHEDAPEKAHNELVSKGYKKI